MASGDLHTVYRTCTSLFTKLLWMYICICLFICPKTFSMDIPRISVDPIASKAAYQKGDTVFVALKISIPEKYHFFDNPKGPGIGKPMEYRVQGDSSILWIDLLKSKSKKITPEVGGWVKAFENSVVFFLRGVVGTSARDSSYKTTLNISGLMCQDACFPIDEKVEFTINIDNNKQNALQFGDDAYLHELLGKTTISQKLEKNSDSTAQFVNLTGTIAIDNNAIVDNTGKSYEWNYTPQNAGSDMNIFLAILFAFLAGIILNAMPCVLPVLGVKILSFAQGAAMDRRSTIVHSLVFSAGVISVFMLLAALASFASFTWGRQFQEPAALVAIIALIVVFALGLFDVYMLSVTGSLSNNKMQKKEGLAGDFFKGVFATILATPCSGPFLGAVLAWSLIQPAYKVFIVYMSIGAGMSFPYILLSTIPKLSRFIPKPGEWMNDFKKIMGFLLVGFGVYLLLGLPSDMVVPTVLFCVLVSFAIVVYTRIAPWGSQIKTKIIAGFAAIAVITVSAYISFMIMYPAFSRASAEQVLENDDVWVDFAPEKLINAHKKGQPVIVDFTANWCMNCQYNYIMVLTKKDVLDKIKEKGVLALKVDMTAPDAVQDSLLRSLGSQSIPFLAIFSGDKPEQPVVMRDVLTKNSVLKELDKLK